MPSPAHAKGCGGGGGGGGGGGHGGGGGGHGKTCTELSTVVGREHCSQFGQWGMLARFPAITFDTELFHEHFLLAPTSAVGTVEHLGTGYTYRVVSDATGGATAWGLRSRTTWRLGGPIYTGLEFDLGGLSSTPEMHVEMADAGPTLSDPFAILVAGRLVVGARAFVTPSFSLSAELAGGGRLISITETSHLLDCTQQTSVSSGAGVLEARGRLDWWAAPHLTIGASIGTSLIDSGDHTFTIGFGGHIRAYDGGY
jgi:hypothetical protein